MAQTNTTIAQTDERTIVITRVFDAPRRLVFEAWTDPRHVAQWWGPPGFDSPLCEMDLRTGGLFRIHLRAPDGVIHPCRGVFRELIEPERIVYAGESEAGSIGCGAGLPPRARGDRHVHRERRQDDGEDLHAVAVGRPISKRPCRPASIPVGPRASTGLPIISARFESADPVVADVIPARG